MSTKNRVLVLALDDREDMGRHFFALARSCGEKRGGCQTVPKDALLRLRAEGLRSRGEGTIIRVADEGDNSL